ncbi:MAG: response regulator transcription factor [Campylobacteraceae bacterium]
MKKIYETVLLNSIILLVEDEPKLRDSFKKVLKLYAKDVIEASNGEEAIDMYTKSYPDIIITDIKMPKINGLEFIEIIRKNNKTIPIVVTSAYADQELLLRSIKLSLVEYIVKPIQEKPLEKALLSCAEHIFNNKPKFFDFVGGWKYDYLQKIFMSPKKDTVLLTPKEIEFIELLLHNHDKNLTKTFIENHLYVYEEVAPPSALKNLVFKLRKKIDPNIIQSVGKVGYKLNV